jgi:hypothetical protein
MFPQRVLEAHYGRGNASLPEECVTAANGLEVAMELASTAFKSGGTAFWPA